MATNEVFRDADHLTLPVASGTKSGDPVMVGSLPGVAQTDRDADGNATVWLKGAYKLNVDGAIAAVATPVYHDGSTTLTATATDNDLFGYALETKGTGEGVITVRIAQV